MGYKQKFTFIGILALIAGLIACGDNNPSSNDQVDWSSRPCDFTLVDTVRTKITIYTDSVNDTTETSLQYISFVYEKDSLGTLDTLTADTVSTKCYFDGDKVTSCNSSGLIITPLPDLNPQSIPFDHPLIHIYQLTPIDTCDTCPKICYDQEILYDTTYTTKTIHTNIIHRDTIFVNYGENALATNVIPYKAEAPKADTSAIREKFKEIPADTTLNVQVYGTLTFEGLPKSAFANPLPIIGITTSFPINHYPISVPTPKIYAFSNGFHPENDTTITWNLIISQDDTKDTLAITSIFKK